MKKYSWDELYTRADGCACHSPELRAKDEARGQLGELIKREKGYDIEECECPEEEIEHFLDNRERPLFFDEDGNILNTIWFRVGMEAQISDEEMLILTKDTDRKKANQLMKEIITKSILSGETYILSNYDLDGYDNPDKEVDFYFDNEPLSEAKKFKIDQTYTWTDWFTGGTTRFVVKSIENNTITMKAVRHELDGVHTMEESFPIETDENGNECILMTEYAGQKGYIYAE